MVAKKRAWTLPAELRPLIVYTVSVNLALHLYASLIIPFARSLGMTPIQIGLYMGLFGIVAVGSSAMGGFLGDRYGPHKVLFTGRVCAFLRLGFLAVAKSPAFLYASGVSHGLQEMSQGPFYSVTSRISGDHNRATVLGLVNMIVGAAGASAPIVGGMLALRYGPKTVFVCAMPLTILSMLLLSRLKPSEAETSGQPAPGRSLLNALKKPEAEIARLVLLFAVFNGAYNAVINLVLPLYAQDRLGANYVGLSGMSAVASLGAMVTSVVGGRLADKHDRVRTAGVIFILGMLPYFGLPLVRTMTGLYAIFFLTALIGSAATPGFFALVLESVTPELRSSFFGSFLGVIGVSQALSVTVLGRLYAIGPELGLSMLYAVTLSSMALAVFIMKRARTLHKRATERT